MLVVAEGSRRKSLDAWGFDSLPKLLSACLDYTQDVCPNCGDYADALVERTGWCISCTQSLGNCCIYCRTEVPENHGRQICWDCKKEQWLARYANLIELVMLTGVKFSKACLMVQDAIRPICVVCGGQIKGGTPGESLFCSNTERCVKVRNKYRRLINNGLAPNLAIIQAVQQKRG